MKQDVLKQGHTIMLNTEFESIVGTNLECEKEK